MTQTVFISGAGRGLGKALAEAYAQAGWQVLAGVHHPTGELASFAREFALDIADPASVVACANAVAAKCESIDLLINNAAILGPMDEALSGQTLDYQAMARVYDVNVLGSLRLTEALWPLLVRGRRKLIVNISSEAGSIGQCWRSGLLGYGMSKAALNMLSAQLHNAARPQGGRVMVLHPGWVRSYMQGHLDTNAELEPEQSAAALIKVINTRGAESHEHPLYLDWLGRALSW